MILNNSLEHKRGTAFNFKCLTTSMSNLMFFVLMIVSIFFSEELFAQTIIVNETSVTSSSYTVLNDELIEIKIVGAEGGQGDGDYYAAITC